MKLGHILRFKVTPLSSEIKFDANGNNVWPGLFVKISHGDKEYTYEIESVYTQDDEIRAEAKECGFYRISKLKPFNILELRGHNVILITDKVEIIKLIKENSYG
jgi:hypothetical protein